ncbi:MAG TPA: MmcQ/YjbR family DNA-binding protein [Gemmatimonadales bacterium]|nr:MmcQ/YjbR family DNA-binding protein [Gemmatimonadales bacterium]
MTANEFRRLALSLPETAEAAHMAHPDFRVAGKIFATLGYPRGGWAMVRLTPEQQELFVRTEPKAFVPVKGKWGEKGATNVVLRYAAKAAVREALMNAWRNKAPARLIEE